MKNLKQLSLVFVLMLPAMFSSAQYLITGNLDSDYENKIVHLDMLDEWDDFSTVSDEMTIKSIRIEENGNFKFEGNELSDKQGFYRIRFTSIDEPAVTIKSTPKNYIHFIFSNKDTIEVVNFTFLPNHESNEELLKHLVKKDIFTKAVQHPENGLHEKLLQSKYKAYCKNEILNSQNTLGNMFCLATGIANLDDDAIPIKDDLVLYEKVHQELQNKIIRPSYAQSLEKILILHKHPNKSINKKIYGLSTLLFLSLLANVVFIFYLIKRKTKAKIKPPNITTLTNKEKEVLQLIIEKKSNKEIATSLFVSDATVKTHINNMYRKLGVNSRKEAIELYKSSKSTLV